ncbi:hypothetical protein OUC_1247 [Helicobacter pylori R018c]|uniref:Uncharacterized protein n=1 Tax=Helicobacter pylori R018c TaxID=1145110 RepID=K2JYU5_HELPX|nr:hypothetical protein OUC_1247 [Helicobacter pylori R018c]
MGFLLRSIKRSISTFFILNPLLKNNKSLFSGFQVKLSLIY